MPGARGGHERADRATWTLNFLDGHHYNLLYLRNKLEYKTTFITRQLRFNGYTKKR